MFDPIHDLNQHLYLATIRRVAPEHSIAEVLYSNWHTYRGAVRISPTIRHKYALAFYV